ncbi:MAG: ABC-F family ATP-binding cassette domain-containing protein [Clostridiales bacterium]|nr:ABC-F family ATP-binding cassette domain-containing protein [Clostridiales bacterium]
MAAISIRNLSFTYPGSVEPVFTGLSAQLDTAWKLGLVGRNGRGKTTLLHLLSGRLRGVGLIESPAAMDYFPYDMDMGLPAGRAMRGAVAPFDQWAAEMEALLRLGDERSLDRWGELERAFGQAGGYEIDDMIAREASKLGIDPAALTRPLSTFSPGEITRMKIAAMFLRRGAFPLIDEPTNHLDADGRRAMARYLSGRSGFIVVSHDRRFLDETIDHVMALDKAGVRVEQGNYSSYRENKRLRDEYEIERNERLGSEIGRLTETAREKAAWSDRVEATKIGGHVADRGHVGHLAAKAMKRALTIRRRTERAIEEKKALLRDLEYASALSIHPLDHPANVPVRLREVSAGYGGEMVIEKLSLEVNRGDRIALVGPNGSGKSTLLKLILGELTPDMGSVTRASGIEVSYLPQTTGSLQGTPHELAEARGLDKSYFLMLLRKLDFPREAFERDMRGYSMGQQKKVLLAACMARPAHLYVWDEPLNYVDLPSREQVEDMLADSTATMVFVEHDQAFVDRVATRVVRLNGRGAAPAAPGR